MAKLYAELTSDKGGRIVGKAGNEWLHIAVKQGNSSYFNINVNYGDGSVEIDNKGYSPYIKKPKTIKLTPFDLGYD